MAKRYIPLHHENRDGLFPSDDGGNFEASFRPHKKTRTTVWLAIMLVISLLVNMVALSFWKGVHKKIFTSPEAPSSYAKAIELPIVYKHFWWNTEYSSVNDTLQDKLWDGILPSHGFVAIDRDEAAKKNYPESMFLPGDKSKGVYLLESYHQLHCLRILHKTLRESLKNVDFTWKPGSHIDHCFDYLIQITMCNADTTPLYTFGQNTAGDGQLHQCKDWNALREYATENRACYRDTIEDVPLGEHFGYCDDGEDGMIEPSRQFWKMDSN